MAMSAKGESVMVERYDPKTIIRIYVRLFKRAYFAAPHLFSQDPLPRKPRRQLRALSACRTRLDSDLRNLDSCLLITVGGGVWKRNE